MLTTHLHLVPRLKMGIAVVLFSLLSPMTCYDVTFTFTFTLPCSPQLVTTTPIRTMKVCMRFHACNDLSVAYFLSKES